MRELRAASAPVLHARSARSRARPGPPTETNLSDTQRPSAGTDANTAPLPFEDKIQAIEAKLAELRVLASSSNIDLAAQLGAL